MKIEERRVSNRTRLLIIIGIIVSVIGVLAAYVARLRRTSPVTMATPETEPVTPSTTHTVASSVMTAPKTETSIAAPVADDTADDDVPQTTMMKAQASLVLWLVYLGLAVMALLLTAILPRPFSTLAFVAMIVMSLGVAVYQRRVQPVAAQTGQNIFASLRITTFRTTAEIIAVLIIALFFTKDFQNTDPSQKLPGGEAEWLTSSAYLVSDNLREYGYIPLWQPYFEFGEPLVDNPFSFILNPILSAPSMLSGGVQGIKQSIVLTTIVAGLGGWVLGYVMRFSWVGRILLAVLMIGKGNMLAMIGSGYFQLGVSQAYMPWVIAGTIAMLRSRRERWPIVLTAVAFLLMFWTGNIWYTLPMAVTMACLVVLGVIDTRGRKINWGAIKRISIAGGLTLGLSMVTFLPIWAQRDRIGGHPDLIGAGQSVDLLRVIEQYVNGSKELYNLRIAPGEPQFYYSFIVPLWFLLLIFIIIPPIWPYLHRPGMPQMWRIWMVGIFVIVYATLWGAGGNPAIEFLYDNFSLLRQWRFVGRALAIGSFWIAILVAMRVDGLWRALRTSDGQSLFGRGLFRIGRNAAALGLIGVSGLAALQVNNQWFEFAGTVSINTREQSCVTWLRASFPDEELSVYRLGYDATTTYLQNQVRLWNIEADYFPIADEATLGHELYLPNVLPEFAIAWDNNTRTFLRDNDYTFIDDSPKPAGDFNCLLRREHALQYAYTVPLGVVAMSYRTLDARDTTPIPASNFERRPDHITLQVEAHPREHLVVTIQERAYPGWTVKIDGQQSALESVGAQLGVILPADGEAHTVEFNYRPPLLYAGGAITLLTWLAAIIYLLHGDRKLLGWLGRRNHRSPTDST